MVVNSPLITSFGEVNQVGIAIRTYEPRATANHVGLIYKFDGPTPLMLHFTAIYVDGEALCENEYLWLDLGDDFTDIDRTIICGHIKKVADANPNTRLAYGYDTPGGYINGETGEIMPSLGAFGLTCATFILEVLDSCGYKLVDLKSWPKALKDDVKWQKKMVEEVLKRPDISQDAIDRQKKNFGKTRYLPEQIAASTQVTTPATRGSVLKQAQKIRKELKAHFARMKESNN